MRGIGYIVLFVFCVPLLTTIDSVIGEMIGRNWGVIGLHGLVFDNIHAVGLHLARGTNVEGVIGYISLALAAFTLSAPIVLAAIFFRVGQSLGYAEARRRAGLFVSVVGFAAAVGIMCTPLTQGASFGQFVAGAILSVVCISLMLTFQRPR